MFDIEYKLEYLPLFHKDLEEKLGYIAYTLNSPQAANELLDLVERKILERQPVAEAFEKYKSRKDRKYPYYRIYVKNYVVFYVVKETAEPNVKIMEVRRFLYGKQDMPKWV